MNEIYIAELRTYHTFSVFIEINTNVFEVYKKILSRHLSNKTMFVQVKDRNDPIAKY